MGENCSVLRQNKWHYYGHYTRTTSPTQWLMEGIRLIMSELHQGCSTPSGLTTTTQASPTAFLTAPFQGTNGTKPYHSTPQPQSAARPPMSKAVLFKPGQKRAITDYPLFAQDDEYIRWVEVFRSVAQDHGTFNVLVHDYGPTDKDDAKLFRLQNTFMYSVLNKVVTAPHAQSIVQNFANTFNVQGAWAALMDRYINSPAAKASISDLARDIQDARLTPSYPGSYEQWIDEFCQLLYDYDNMVPPANRYNDEQKIDMLHVALGGINELNSMQAQVNNNVMAGIHMPFLNVVATYKTNCVHLDRKRMVSKKSWLSRRMANAALSMIQETDDDLNNLCVQIQAWVAKRQTTANNRKGNMMKEAWEALSNDKKAAWRSLSIETREKILGKKTKTSGSIGGSSNLGRANLTYIQTDEDEDEEEEYHQK